MCSSLIPTQERETKPASHLVKVREAYHEKRNWYSCGEKAADKEEYNIEKWS